MEGGQTYAGLPTLALHDNGERPGEGLKLKACHSDAVAAWYATPRRSTPRGKEHPRRVSARQAGPTERTPLASRRQRQKRVQLCGLQRVRVLFDWCVLRV